MQRRDDLYPADFLEAAESIRSFVAKLDRPDRDAFLGDDLVRSAVFQKLSVIGEAAARVSDETRALNPEIPWHQARGTRNLLIHAYFSVDWDIVWNTATDAVPRLAAQVARVVESHKSRP
ncbi:MAG: DUF86 domain-containing protein [bacterium]